MSLRFKNCSRTSNISTKKPNFFHENESKNLLNDAQVSNPRQTIRGKRWVQSHDSPNKHILLFQLHKRQNKRNSGYTIQHTNHSLPKNVFLNYLSLFNLILVQRSNPNCIPSKKGNWKKEHYQIQDRNWIPERMSKITPWISTIICRVKPVQNPNTDYKLGEDWMI